MRFVSLIDYSPACFQTSHINLAIANDHNASPIVETSMFFMTRDPLHQKEKPYAYRYAAAIDIPQSNFALEERDHIPIKDIRSHLQDFSIEKNGFAILKMTNEIQYSDYFDTLKVEVYFRQLESILRTHLQASHVQVFRHAVSSRPPFPPKTSE